MAAIQLRALGTVNVVDKHGQRQSFHAGDWFACGKMKAIELIETGQAELPGAAEGQRAITEELSDCGILVLGGTVKDARKAAGLHHVDAQEFTGSLRLPWERTLIWNAEHPLDPQQIALGFVRVAKRGRYDSWEMAAMLKGRDLLASQVGTKEAKARTRESVGDLRLPVYDTGAVWVRKTSNTEALIKAWDNERESGDNEHAFLRALYANRVLLCTLPAAWLRRLP